MPLINFDQVNVYNNGVLCGFLIKKEANYLFKYCESYLNDRRRLPPISINFPLQAGEFESNGVHLHAFFDNLASEGWLRQHQADALKTTSIDKFAILTRFGYDLAGAVYFDSPDLLNLEYPITFDSYVTAEKLKTNFSVESRASISGMQRKVFVRKNSNCEFVITQRKEISTHIAKLFSDDYPEIIELEFLSTLAVKNLIPEDLVCDIEIGVLREINEKALIVRRFDRGPNNERFHFEEFNSLLNKAIDDKYNASYDEIGLFILNSSMCQNSHQTCLRVYKRILTYILIGNTDAHLKNFAMFHAAGSLVPTPMYDILCSSFYSKFTQLALKINNQVYQVSDLKPKHLVNLGRQGFGLGDNEITSAVKSLESKLESTVDFLERFQNDFISREAKTKRALIDIISKRWNGSFKGIFTYLDKRKKK